MEMPTQEAIEILGECYPVVCTAVSQATNRIFLNFPGYRESDETPPAVRNNRSKWIDIRPDFDGLLGQYHPPRITVYRKAIVAVANEFDLHPEHLKRLVDLHEWAHALHHLGSSSRTHVFSASRKAKKSKNFRETSEELKEQIAQLATLLTLRSLAERVRYEKLKKFYDELENVLFSLMSRQSAKYRLPDFIREAGSARMREKLRVLFLISDRETSLNRDDVAGLLK